VCQGMPRTAMILHCSVMIVLVHVASASRRAHLAAARRHAPRLGLIQHCPTWERAFVDCVADADTRDVNACVRAAEELARVEAVEGVVTFVEHGVSAAAAVAEHLGLPGIGTRSATLARDKYQMRQAMSAGGVPCPRFALASDVDHAAEIGREFGYPLVIKPVIGGGSQYVRRVDGAAEVRHHFSELVAGAWDTYDYDPLYSLKSQYGGAVLVESYVAGIEVSVESLIVDGRTEVLAIHDKPLPMTGPLFTEFLSTTPSRLPSATQDRLRELVDRCHRALGISRGASHAEFRVPVRGDPVALEVAARIGGGAIYQSVRTSVGVDMVAAVIDIACGRTPVSARHEPRPSAELAFYADREGVLQAVHGVDEARADPRILELVIYKRPGDEILTLPRAFQGHGHALMTASSVGELDLTARNLLQRVRFEVLPRAISSLPPAVDS
jgi:biotin carboxylase